MALSTRLRRRLPLFAVSAAFATFTTMLGSPASADEAKRTFSLSEATISDIHAALISHQISCVSLVRSYLRRIKAYDDYGPKINSYITVSANAVKQATSRDAAFAHHGLTGPLTCVPVVLKDNIDTVAMPTTGGSKTLAGTFPSRDATVAERLEAAGRSSWARQPR